MKTFDINKLKNVLQKHKSIVFSVLFGSAQDGKLVKHGSDIDIGIYLSTPPTVDILAEIIGLCQDSLKYDNIDISILNTNDPILAFEAISGKLLTCRRYEDEMIRINKNISYQHT